MSMETADSYRTLGSAGTHEIKIKASRFIARGFPVADADEATALLENIRKREYSATHHCFAWVTGLESEIFKYSDDGEPSGTAGRPIYQVLIGRKLKNTLIVVTRYYGGTKLGTGGLIRAYSRAASEMLDKADIVEKLICDRLEFSLPFALYDRLMRIINTDKLEIVEQDFSDLVKMVINIRKSKTDKFMAQLIELTGGKIAIIREG
ncbi:MAG: YigZ family protein [FCB group bacterium]|nr:YigZ family protein [FCB group bacterium]